MNIQTTYEKLGGNLEVMRKRLRKDTLIAMMLEDFLEDDSFAALAQAMDAGDTAAAFDAAHTLKGVAMNLEIGILMPSASALTESLRHGGDADTAKLYEAVSRDYEAALAVIRAAADD